MKNSAYLIGVDALAARRETSLDYLAAPAPSLATQVAAEIEAAIGDSTGQPLALVPMGDIVPVIPPATSRMLESPFDDVPDEAWTDFVLAMKTQAPSASSASNELGMFAMKVRRLADLGLVTNLKNSRGPTGRMVWTCDWVSPMSENAFLASPKQQYKAFVVSTKRYYNGLLDGTIEMPDDGRPDGMTLSGALAILHKCGPNGLKTWSDEDDRFPSTRALYDGANGAF